MKLALFSLCFFLSSAFVSGGILGGCKYLQKVLKTHNEQLALSLATNYRMKYLRPWLGMATLAEDQLPPLCSDLSTAHPRMLYPLVFLSRDLWRLGETVKKLTRGIREGSEDLTTSSLQQQLMKTILELSVKASKFNGLNMGKKNIITHSTNLLTVPVLF